MRAYLAAVLAIALNLIALPSAANTPEPSYNQTRDWIVANLTRFAGYTSDTTEVAYKDISMDGCRLHFTTSTVRKDAPTETDTFTVSLDSIQSVLWGTENNPPRGYVLFTTGTPMSFSQQRAALNEESAPRSARTTVAALEFGRPGADQAELASHMKMAILHAADLCKAVELASIQFPAN